MSMPLKVFISYSWDSKEHQDWVLNLANRLITEHGIEVILDQYDLQAGKNMTRFMERNIALADKVVLILTPKYKLKAEKSEGGVGFEHSMISQELFEIQANNTKFIPVLRSGKHKDSAPGYIKTLIYHSMVDDMIFESDIWKLGRLLNDKPAIIKPELGTIPNYDTVPLDKDPISEKIKNTAKKLKIEEDRKQYISSPKGIEESKNRFNSFLDELSEKVDFYKQDSEIKLGFGSEREYNHSKNNLYGDISARFKNKDNITYHFHYNFKEGLASFFVTKWNNPPTTFDNYNGMYLASDKPKRLSDNNDKYCFDVDDNMNPKWRDEKENLLDSEDLCKIYIGKVLNDIATT
jgi:TIR domain